MSEFSFSTEELQHAKRMRQFYLAGFLLVLLTFFIPETFKGSLMISRAILLYNAAMAFAFSRSIKIGMFWSILNIFLSPLLIFQLIVLFRIYSKRTKIAQGFFMNDKKSA